MAVRYEQSESTIRLIQTRRGLRWTAGLVVLFSALGMGMTALIGTLQINTTFACDHASGACTLTEGHTVHTMSVASIDQALTETTPSGVSVALYRSEMPRYSTICAGAPDVPALTTELSAFLADATHAPITLHCQGHPPVAMPLGVMPFALIGWLVLFLLASPFSHEITTLFDRGTHTIEVRGRGWARRAWTVKRPLGDVLRIDVRTRYVGYGSRQIYVYAVFADGTDALLWSPAAVTPRTVDERVAAMRAFVASAR